MSRDDVGITVHFLGAMTVPTSTSMASSSLSLGWGSELILTESIVEALRDRTGRVALLELLDDEPAQVRKWGEVKVRRGPWPADLDRIQPGSPQWDDARTAALRAAALLPTDEEQRRAAAAARERYGVPSSSRSRTLMEYER